MATRSALEGPAGGCPGQPVHDALECAAVQVLTFNGGTASQMRDVSSIASSQKNALQCHMYVISASLSRLTLMSAET